MGLQTLDVVRFWYRQYPWDKHTHPFSEVRQQILQHMVTFIKEEGKVLPNVISTMRYFHQRGVQQAIASSSAHELIEQVIDIGHLQSFIAAVCSSEDEKHGKPAPDVYLSAARALAVQPSECLVIEDSYRGALAGQRAGMNVVVLPDSVIYSDPQRLKKLEHIQGINILHSLLELCVEQKGRYVMDGRK